MILYKLRCSNEHDFEAWFHDSASYSIQVDCGDVVCPFCSDTRVRKAAMAPHIGRHRASVEGEQSGGGERRAREVAEHILSGVSEQIVANYDDVGDEFTEEARRIHYGEAKERGIYGEATNEEAAELEDEGIDFFRLPFRFRRND